MLVIGWLACTASMDLPEDPAAAGVPVGVQTIDLDGAPVEIWYPAADSVVGDPGDGFDVTALVPASVTDVVGPIALPPLATTAARDAPVRRAGPYPALLFSHGFGGFRGQSVDVTTHLASRGYVVLAMEHRGRSLPDLLPCLFSPPLDGCDLSAFADDPGPADLGRLRGLVAEIADTYRIDVERLGVLGHSAGGASTGTFTQADVAVDAGLAMAMGPTVTRDVPFAVLAGACDATVPLADVQEGVADGTALTVLDGAGHLAFSDLCELDLDVVAADVLGGRDDLNETFYAGLVALASDGCPGRPVPEGVDCGVDTWGDLAAAQATVRAEATSFFDAAWP